MCCATPVTSRCDTVLGLCNGATRLQVTDKPCDSCDMRLISTEYPQVRVVTSVTDCDEAFVTIIHLHMSLL